MVSEFPIPTADSGPAGIAAGPDGNLWFVEYQGDNVGRITTGGASHSAFYTLTPCRIVDTRNANGPYGGPAITVGADRAFVLAGQCGIPTTAKAVSINLTITQPNAQGDLRNYPGGSSLPLVSTINYSSGQTRANNAVATLGPSGDLTIHCDQASGTVELIIDTNGYFQ